MEDVNGNYRAFIERKSQGGTLSGFAPLWMPEFLFDFQKGLTDWAIRKGRAAIFADCGMGKGQPEGALILTPTGFVPNMTLEIGQMIVGSNGAAYPLKAKYPRGLQETFRVHFSDGSNFVVDSEHLHIIRTNNDRQRSKPWRVLSTQQLLKMPLRYGQHGKSRNIDIPVVAPIQSNRKRHWIHPYVLGVLLGDGCITKGCTVTIADAQILETVRSFLPTGWTLTHKSRYDYKLSHDGQNRRDFIAELRRLGLYGKGSGKKFIPEEYLFDSVDNRVWLLRGLMDTDGYIKDTSQFYSTSEKLADDVLMLVRSLGGVPTKTIKQTSCIHKGTRRQGAPCHILTFSLKTFNPFHLSRKAAKWNPTPRDNGRWIDRIEPCGKQRTMCLSVASPDHSYVTENFIVTHNTPMQLVWAENVVRQTNGRVLILTPLAVCAQTAREGKKFGVACRVARDGQLGQDHILIANYECLSHFSPSDFVGIVCDESSILKHFGGATQRAVTRFCSKLPYRLLCTATAAPNDYYELGTSSEVLGELGHSEMLTRFFVMDDKKRHRMNDVKLARDRHKSHYARLAYRISQQIGAWRFKGHAEIPFWRWVCSWARACRAPSDLGFEDGEFLLPPLDERHHTVIPHRPPEGMLFVVPAIGLKEERDERRRTLQERCEFVAQLVSHAEPAIVWCHLNAEGDLLARLIPDARQIKGADPEDQRIETYDAFTTNTLRCLITKPKIGAWGLNWQHCAHVVSFASHSWEQYYQSIRRCWRFGQTRPVIVDIISTEGEVYVRENMHRKMEAATKMFDALIAHMQESMHLKETEATEPILVPIWL